MTFQVVWTNHARRELNHCPLNMVGRIIDACSVLEQNPLRGPGIKPFGKGVFSLRVAEWRLVYTVESTQVIVRTVGRRDYVYKRLRDLRDL